MSFPSILRWLTVSIPSTMVHTCTKNLCIVMMRPDTRKGNPRFEIALRCSGPDLEVRLTSKRYYHSGTTSEFLRKHCNTHIIGWNTCGKIQMLRNFRGRAFLSHKEGTSSAFGYVFDVTRPRENCICNRESLYLWI